MPIFVDRPQKPGDVEAAAEVRQPGAAGHQDQPAVPDREEFGPRHQGGPDRKGRLHQNLVLGCLGDHQEPAVTQARDGRQGRHGKPRPVGPKGSCLEPEVFGAPEHLRCANLVCSKPMPDLPGFGRNPLEMQQRHEGFEPWIGRSSCCRLQCSFGVLRALVGFRRVRVRQQRLLGRLRIRQSALHHGHRPPQRSSRP